MVTQRSIAAWLLIIVVAMGVRASTISARRARAASRTTTAPKLPQISAASAATRMFGAHWKAGNGYTTELLLKNKDLQNPVTASITLCSVAGQPQQTTEVQIAPGAVRSLNVNDIVRLPLNVAIAGGLVVNSTGPLTGALTIDGPRARSSLPLQGGYRYDTENALYASWWLPDAGSDGSLTLFNSSAQTISVTPSVVAGGREKTGNAFTLPPNASTTLELRRLMGGNNANAGVSNGMVMLHYSGPAHALMPALWLTNPSTGYSLAPEFQALHQQTASQQVTWQYPDVALISENVSTTQSAAPLTAYALLSNGGQSSLTPELTAFYVPAGAKKPKKASLSVAPLMPLETRLVNLSQLLTNAAVPVGLRHVALTVTHGGSPGDLAMSVFSATSSNDLVLKSEGATQPADIVDVSYWQMGTQPVIPKVLNRNKATAQAQVTMYYQTALGLESYVLPVMAVSGHKSQALGLQGVMNAGMADTMGSKIPSGISSGLVVLVAGNVSGERTPPPETGPLCSSDCNAEVSTHSPQPPTLLSGSSAAAKGSTTAPGIQFDSSFCPPIIDEIDPSSGDLGTEVDVIIIGENFEDGDEVSVTGGIEADIPSVSPDGTVIETTFFIDNSVEPGDQTVTVIGSGGESNGITFTVNTPPGPVLESVDPSTGKAGTSVSVLIDLTARAPFRDGDTINVTGGITATVDNISPDGVQVNATFTIPSCAAFGDQQVTVTDAFGQTSPDPVTFTVTGTPVTPNITSITPSGQPPNDWQAGFNNKQIDISGTGFGCVPSVQITDQNGELTFTPATVTAVDQNGQATTIETLVTINPDDPNETAQVVVVNNDGTNVTSSAVRRSAPAGKAPASKATAATRTTTTKSSVKKTVTQNIMIVPPPPSDSAPVTVDIQALTPPTPFIVLVKDPSNPPDCTAGNDIGGAVADRQQVTMGRRVYLLACLPKDSQFQLTNPQWTVSDNTIVVGGFDDGNKGGAPTNDKGVAEPVVFNTASLVLYFTAPTPDTQDFKATFTYTPSNNQPGPSNAALYKVAGGLAGNTKDVTVTATPGTPTIVPAIDAVTGKPIAFLGAGDGSGVRGMEFNAKTPAGQQLPDAMQGGTFRFVQLIKAVRVRMTPGVDCKFGSGLDNFYPYPPLPNDMVVHDTPGVGLSPEFAEVNDNKTFTMFSIWIPPADSACVKTTQYPCTIPVPLGSIDWQWKGAAINTLDSAQGVQGWTKESCSFTGGLNGAQTPTFTPNQTASGYPQWSSRFVNNQSCPSGSKTQ